MKFDNPKQLVDFTLKWNDINLPKEKIESLYKMADLLFSAGLEKGKSKSHS